MCSGCSRSEALVAGVCCQSTFLLHANAAEALGVSYFIDILFWLTFPAHPAILHLCALVHRIHSYMNMGTS